VSNSIDGSRLIVLLVLLTAGMFIATRLVRPRPSENEDTALSPRRWALRGMLFMTLLGLGSGVTGGLMEGELDEAVRRALYTIYAVCWAPAFWMAQLQKALASPAASARLLVDVLGQLGLLLIPVLWFLVFFCAGRLLLARQRRSR
jgi:hypothetical protein